MFCFGCILIPYHIINYKPWFGPNWATFVYFGSNLAVFSRISTLAAILSTSRESPWNHYQIRKSSLSTYFAHFQVILAQKILIQKSLSQGKLTLLSRENICCGGFKSYSPINHNSWNHNHRSKYNEGLQQTQ